MSSILKALRRVESELAEDKARDLHAEVLSSARPASSSSPASRGRLRGSGGIIGALGLLALGAVLGRWLGDAPDTATPDDVTRAAASRLAGEPLPASAAAPTTIEPGASAASVSPTPPLGSAPASLPRASSIPEPRPAVPAPRVSAPPADAVVAVVAPPLPPPTTSVVDLDGEAHLGGTPPRTERGRRPDPVNGKVRAETSRAAAAMPPAPRSPLEVASAPARRPLARPAAGPTALPRVESTVWHPDSMRRRALVDLGETSRDVREGETVGGYLVLAIGPSGVVFRRDGNDVTRRVGQR